MRALAARLGEIADFVLPQPVFSGHIAGSKVEVRVGLVVQLPGAKRGGMRENFAWRRERASRGKLALASIG